MATITYESYGEKYELSFRIDRYSNNDNLAILAMCKDEDGFVEPYGNLTVNIEKLNKDNWGCVDTNNWRDAIDLIEQNKLGTPTGMVLQSGYCTYPVYEFDMNELKKYEF